VQASSKRIPGVARLLLGLFAWLGEKFGLITRRTAGWANFGSAVSGVYRRLRLTADDGHTCRESGPPYLAWHRRAGLAWRQGAVVRSMTW
jgi:hypothetical protein